MTATPSECKQFVARYLQALSGQPKTPQLVAGYVSDPFAGVPATGRSVSAPLMIIYRVGDGRIVEHWMQFDAAAVVTQLQSANVAV